MKVKKVLTSLAVAGAIIVPFSVFAATSDTSAAKAVRGFFGIDTSKLTDTQKADVTDYTQKMANLQKEFINKMVSNGSMTKEQGDTAIQRIDDAVKNGTYSKGLFGGGFGNREKKGEFGLFGIDISKLTNAQKADMTDSFKKIAGLQKDLISKEVASGLITKEQGDSETTKIDKAIADGNFTHGIGMFACPGMNRIDPSKLTAQQKTDLQNFSDNLAALEKELVNKMVANGAITKDQGDAAIQKIDNMAKNGFSKGMMMGKRGFRGQKYNTSTDSQSSSTSGT